MYNSMNEQVGGNFLSRQPRHGLRLVKVKSLCMFIVAYDWSISISCGLHLPGNICTFLIE
jgi:hypothetical protein